jgi:hypothetical protein
MVKTWTCHRVLSQDCHHRQEKPYPSGTRPVDPGICSADALPSDWMQLVSFLPRSLPLPGNVGRKEDTPVFTSQLHHFPTVWPGARNSIDSVSLFVTQKWLPLPLSVVKPYNTWKALEILRTSQMLLLTARSCLQPRSWKRWRLRCKENERIKLFTSHQLYIILKHAMAEPWRS